MDKPTSTESLAERPLLDPKNDVLGYDRFARVLADALATIDPADGLVLALHGSWGAGKSTMINFVTNYLSASQGEEQETTVIRFNPWWFSGQEDLIRIFFEELISKLRNRSLSDRTKQQALATLAPLLRIFGKAVSKLKAPIVGDMLPVESIGDAVAQIGEELGGLRVTSLTEVKDKVESLLKEVSTRIFVVIDDVDRLTADEIRQIFRMVKAVANFSNITYLLAFDRRVVTAALGTEQVSGEDYLAKIVQITFELPLPDQTSLRYLLEHRLRKLLAATPPELFAPNHWSAAYLDRFTGSDAAGIQHFMRTPRDVVRLTNHLSLTYRIVQKEVNAVDFITIETLRIFRPAVYQFIRSNPDAFCSGRSMAIGQMAGQSRLPPPPPRNGPPGSDFPGSSPPNRRLKEIYEPTLQKFLQIGAINENDVEPINRLVEQMFPSVARMRRPDDLRAGETSVRAKGISDAEFFPLYFRFSPPEGGVSRNDVQRAFDNVEAFKRDLDQLVRQRTPRRPTELWAERPNHTEQLLYWFSQNIDEIPEKFAAQTFKAVFAARAAPDSSLLVDMLRRVPGEQRFELLKDAIAGVRHAADLHAAVALVDRIGTPHLNRPPGTHLPPTNSDRRDILDRVSLEELQSLVAGRIAAAAADGEIWNTTQLRMLLFFWYAWGDRVSLKAWGREASDKDLPKLLGKLAEPSGYAEPGSTSVPYLRPEWLSFFIDPDKLVERAKAARETGLPPHMQSVIDALTAGYEELQNRQKIENPFS
jgi:predicted KAP-like P-loop ATPase